MKNQYKLPKGMKLPGQMNPSQFYIDLSKSILGDGICSIDEYESFAHHGTLPELSVNITQQIEFDLLIQSMSKETQSFLSIVQNAPTEFLNSIFSNAKMNNNRKKYNATKINKWLRSKYGINKTRTIFKELKNLYECIL